MHDATPSLPVLILYTGGTIGMQSGPQGLAPGAHFEQRLADTLARFPSRVRDALPAYHMICYSRLLDSSAVTPAHWQAMAEDIVRHRHQYRGFVVLHGTDTMAWTASSLAFQLAGLGKPVVLTGAMRPLESTASDAPANVLGALMAAGCAELDEVVIHFAGCLYRAVCTTKVHCHALEAFQSPDTPILGNSDANGCRLQKSALRQVEPPHFTALHDYSALCHGEVVRLALWPGIQAWQLDAWLNAPTVRGAVIELWGAGNLGDTSALLEVLAQASATGKLLAGVRQTWAGQVQLGAYAAGHGLNEAGILCAGAMTVEAAYTKLVDCLARDGSRDWQAQRFMTDLVGES